MIVKLQRFLSNSNETLGILSIDGKPIAWTMEDEYRAKDKKVMGETRIPEGTYTIGLRTEGGHHATYAKKFPAIHKGMLELKDVPNFQYILIHIGNTDKDTAGCILVGDSPGPIDGAKLSIAGSTSAYQKVYKAIIAAISKGEQVQIVVENIEKK
jgi:hypothetical protein